MKFKVGDVVITKRCPHGGSHIPGRECTIITVDPLDPNGTFYETDISAGPAWQHTPYHNWWGCDGCFELKGLPEKKEALGEWELCPWRPELALQTELKHE